MISRLLISAGARTLNKPMVQRLVVRQVHKGPDGVPPMRWMSIPEKMATYLFICFSFLAYPTYVLLNLDNIRPRPDSSLSPETQAALEEHRKARLAGFKQ